MDIEYRIVGMNGNIPFDEPAEKPYFPPMEFLEYVTDDSENVCGIKYLIDLGRGYGFDNGKEEITIKLSEEISFTHEYTDTSDGTWNTDSYRVVVRLAVRLIEE